MTNHQPSLGLPASVPRFKQQPSARQCIPSSPLPFDREIAAKLLQYSTANLPENAQWIDQQRSTLQEIQRVLTKFEKIVQPDHTQFSKIKNTLGTNIHGFHFNVLIATKSTLHYFWQQEAQHENTLLEASIEACEQMQTYPSQPPILEAIAPHWDELISVQREAEQQVFAQIGKKVDDIFLSESERKQLIRAKENIIFQRMTEATQFL